MSTDISPSLNPEPRTLNPSGATGIGTGRWTFRSSRTIRVVGSFGAVLVAYWAYALLAVPWIEPSVALYRTEEPSESDLARIPSQQSRRIEELQGLFPPGSWELDNPKILESDQVKLLLHDYANLGDGRVELRPCTVIFTPESAPADAAQRDGRAIVLQAPEGALLKFSEAFDLRRARVGRLVSGELRGQITIRSNGKLPGPEDDLLATTRDVTMTEEEITTPHVVEFRLGPNHGRGSDMHMKFLPGDRIAGSRRHGPNVAGIESFQVNRLEQLHLVAAGDGLMSLGQESRKNPRAQGAGSGLPVEIACRGPFRFDLVQQLATFEDRVDVLQVHPNGPSDQLQCELLSIYFARPRVPSPSPAGTGPAPGKPAGAGPLDLQPRRIEARGNPVVMMAPSQKLHARAEQMEFDLWSRRILLYGSQEAFLQHGANEIHGRSVQYQASSDGRLGQAAAQGPGWLRGQATDRPDQQLEVRWNDQLRLRPHEQQHVISLTGGAELSFVGMGRLAAREIHFWLFEVPSPDGKTTIRPDRMLARHEVQLKSAQFSGSVDELQVWFEPAEEPPKGLAAGISNLQAMNRAAALTQHLPGAAWIAQRGANGTDGWVAIGAGAAGAAGAPSASAGGAETGKSAGGPERSSDSPPPPPPAAPAQHFEIVGRLLRARLTLLGVQSELTELLVEGNVRFAEAQTARPEELPLLINGDQVHVVDGSKPSATLTVLGNPAHVEARGLGLTGSNINLNRGTNMLWIEGQGRMTFPLDRDLQGRTLSNPGYLDVRWQDRMAFDGRTARFEESVAASAQHQRLETRSLEVVFRQPIRFADAKPQARPEPEKIFCRGGATMESRSLDERGQTSMERVNVKDLAVNLISGATTAAGPGWMSSVRRGSSGDLLRPGPGNALAGALAPDGTAESAVGRFARRPSEADAAAASAADADKLVYLHVSFQDSIAGNLKTREMTFRDRIRVVYGPVESWEGSLDPARPENLGPEAVLMNCDQLTVAEIAAPVGNRQAMALEARGNTEVEGRTFTARGARLSYDEAKGLLILEGDGRNDAELFRQQEVGGPRSHASARKIYYLHRADQVRVEGARSFQTGPIPAASPPKP